MTPRRENADDTFAKLLRGHARVRGGRPAFRHKVFGIWRTWTWAEVYDETRALAQGLAGLGFAKGDRIAIAGANRPRLYWSMTAAQMLGAVPVPVYADSVADEIALVLDERGRQFHRRAGPGTGRQDALDRRSPAAADASALRRGRAASPITTTRGCSRSTGHGRRARGARRADVAEALDRRIDEGDGGDPSVILYTSGTTGRSKGVVLSGERCIAAARDTVAFDNLTDRDEVLAYLPLAWVGDHYLNYAQGFVAGFCMACPESADTAAEDLREIGPTFHFAPPRVFEAMLTRVMIRMEDAERAQALAVPSFHGRRAPLGREDRQRRAGAMARPRCTMRSARC